MASPGKSTSSTFQEDWQNITRIFEGLIPTGLGSKNNQSKHEQERVLYDAGALQRNRRSSSVPSEEQSRRSQAAVRERLARQNARAASQTSNECKRSRNASESNSQTCKPRSPNLRGNSSGLLKRFFDQRSPNNRRTLQRQSAQHQNSEDRKDSIPRIQKEQSMKRSQESTTCRITMGASNANFRQNISSTLVRGPFVRAPTTDQAVYEGQQHNGKAIRKVLTKDQSDSSNSSPETRDDSMLLGGLFRGNRSPVNTSDGTVDGSTQVTANNSNNQARLSPFTSPCTSPFLRRRRAQNRAGSTGSAQATSCDSKGSLAYSPGGLTSPSPNNLLSPFSMSPTPSNPTTPTTPSQTGLLSRRLSSCRPSISSCSSMLFSFSSSKEASPDVGILSPCRSPRGTNNQTVSGSNVFVYPTSPSRNFKLKDEIGAINPDLYRTDSTSTEGNPDSPASLLDFQLKFSAKYNHEKEWLEVFISKIKNVPKDIHEISFRIMLLPDEKRAISANFPTDTNIDLVIKKSYIFPVQKSELSSRTLKIMVSGVKSSKRKVSIADVAKSLRSFSLDVNDEMKFSENLKSSGKSEEEVELPKMSVALCYNGGHERLTVAIYEIKGLQRVHCGSNKCYVKTTLTQTNLRSSKSKKTDVLKITNVDEPDSISFNQSFNFRLDRDSISEAGVTLQIMEVTNLLDKDRTVGTVVIGGPMFAKGSGEDHWRKIINYQKENVLMWHDVIVGTNDV